MSSAMGRASPRPCGTSMSIMLEMMNPSTPFAISSSASFMSGGSMSTKVRTRRPSRNGGMISRRT